MEFMNRGIEGGERLLLHGGVSPGCCFFGAALRHDYDKGKVAGVVSNGVTEADVGLQEAVVAALSIAVQEEDDGPLLILSFVEVRRHKNLVAVGLSGHRHGAVEEASFW